MVVTAAKQASGRERNSKMGDTMKQMTLDIREMFLICPLPKRLVNYLSGTCKRKIMSAH